MAVRGQQRRAENRANKAILRKAYKEQFAEAKDRLRSRLKEFDGFRKKGDLLQLSEVCDEVAMDCRLVLGLDYMLRTGKFYKYREMLRWMISGDPVRRAERAKMEAEDEARKKARIPSPKQGRA
jgi:hypothetical protein